MKKPKILFCDLDDTLISPLSGRAFPQGIWDMKFKLDVFKKIKELEVEYIFIVTNQGGIGRFISEEDFNKKIDYISASIKSYVKHPNFKLIESMYCPSMDKNDPFRKPNAGMLEYLSRKYEIFKNYTKEDMLMIGDASGGKGDFSNSDLKTAMNFGIQYLDVNDFLKTIFN